MAIAFLGSAASASAGAAATITLGRAVPARTNVLVMIAQSSNAVFTTPVDSGGNTYTVVDNLAHGNGTCRIGFYLSTLSTALANGGTISDTAGGLEVCLGAWLVDTPIAFDGTPTSTNGEGRGTGTAVSLNLQNGALVGPYDYLIGGVCTIIATTLTGVTAGWNLDGTATGGTTNLRLWCFSQSITAGGTFPLSGTVGSTDWEAIVGPYHYTPPVPLAYPLFPKTIMRR